ncbi:hypothetical protein [Nocardioides lijunqiniae]|uniref:hypothetical protein n=1 Tax=Nocardioides lijunqiniae TaxID=2760832 RepID=UPI00187765B9|nr:hypothetical protein [Nocardioides lijunqiniae]
MTLFWIATVVAVVITFLFVREGVREFLHLRDGGDRGAEVEVPAEDTGRFSLKALGGVVASFSCIVLISVTPYAWYLLPVLSLGSAVAVVVAFSVDRRARVSKGAV